MSARSKPLAILMSLAVAAIGLGVVTSSPVAAAAPTWETTFRDDFTGTGLPNPNNWQLTLGTKYDGGPDGFGTGEIETMTNNPNNVDVRNGNLYITPQRDAAGAWTSARVETTRANFKPADGGVMHVESRLQMPNVTGAEAKGYWPAFWMLGGSYRQNRWSWPGIGEFDIMENVQGLNWTYNVLHCGTWGGPCNEPEGINNGGTPCLGTTCQAGFHVYGMEWDRTGTADELRWYLDGVQTYSVRQNQVPAATWSELADHAGYFVILNVAMGGAFPNKVDQNGGPFPSTKPGVPLVVDYVEVKYAGGQGTPTDPTTPPPTTTTTSTSITTTSTTTTPPTTTSTPPPDTTSSTPTPPAGTGGPTNLHVTGQTGSSITLGWDGAAGASYDVLRSGQRIATGTGRSFTDIGLLPNTPYVYSVRGNGVTTPELTTTLGSTPPPTSTESSTGTPSTVPTIPTSPSSPSSLAVTGSTPNSITIGWNGAVGASYDVLRSGIKIATVTGLTFTDIGLLPNTPYLYSVRGNGVTTPQITATIH